MLEEAGFQKLVFEDFYDVLLSLIQQIVTPEPGGTTLTPETLLEAFQSPEGERLSSLRLSTAPEDQNSSFELRCCIPETCGVGPNPE